MDSIPTTLDALRDRIPDYARDLRLNLGTVLTPAGAPGLSERADLDRGAGLGDRIARNAFTRPIEARPRAISTRRT